MTQVDLHTGASHGRIAPSSAAASGRAGVARAWQSVLVAALLASLIIPLEISIGQIRLPFYRVVLLIAVAPLAFQLVAGRFGRLRLPDYAIFGICFWLCLSLFVHHPASMALEPAGVILIETLGAYLVGRACVRSPDDFHRLVRVLFILIVLILPFAIIETLTTRNLLLDFYNLIGSSDDDVHKPLRWGLDRVQGPFSHPILYGVFCGVTLSLAYKVLGYGKPFVTRMARTGVVGFAATLALSSGPLTALTAQTLLIGWEGLFGRIRNHWKLLALGAAALVVLIELVANRSSPEIFIHYFAFNGYTAWNRLLIWEFGSQAVLDNPLFGLGLNDWPRAWFMSPSMDMFWLVPAVRGGLVPGLLFQAVMIWTLLTVTRREGLGERAAAYRTGFAMCLVGFYLVGWTVHFWEEIYVQFLVILGAGMWMLDWRDDGETEESEPRPPPRDPSRAVPYRSDRRARPVNAAEPR